MANPKNTQYLFLDMNSFFASCEQQENISYRNKPLIVTPVNTPNCSVVSASYEAKAYGIKTGTRIKDARCLCPQLIVCSSNTGLYLSYHQKLVKVLESFSPWTTVMSVDEAYIKLSPSEQNSESAKALALKIKQTIQSKLGKYLTSSIGLGPNIFLAKQAAEYQKPNGLIEIKLENLQDYYRKIKLTDLKGINFRMQARLNALGFYQPLDLYHASAQILKDKLGIVGEYWHLKLHGYDNDCQRQSAFQSALVCDLPKSIGHSHVLEPKFRTWKLAWAVCLKLMEKVGRRLRSNRLQTEGISLYIKFIRSPLPHFRSASVNDRTVKSYCHKSIKVQPFSDNLTLTKLIRNLWQKIPQDEYLPLKIGVSVFNLSQPLARQRRIFPAEEKSENLSLAVDKINDRHGSFTIKPANLLGLDSAAPDRISFGRPIFD